MLRLYCVIIDTGKFLFFVEKITIMVDTPEDNDKSYIYIIFVHCNSSPTTITEVSFLYIFQSAIVSDITEMADIDESIIYIVSMFRQFLNNNFHSTRIINDIRFIVMNYKKVYQREKIPNYQNIW